MSNVDKHKEQKRNDYLRHKIKRLQTVNTYRLKNKGLINKNRCQRKKTNINFRIICNLRGRIYHAVKYSSKSQKTITLLGCNLDELKIHLEKQFKEGMTWDNYGKNGWHIDHIIPCAVFDMSDPIEQKQCFHYSNLQPLWAKDNIIKSDNCF